MNEYSLYGSAERLPLALHLNRNPHLRDTQIVVDHDAALDRVIVASEDFPS